MASTTFVDNQTIIYASWLNDVNDMTYNGVVLNGVLNAPTTMTLQTGGLDALTIDASQLVYIGNLSVGALVGSISFDDGIFQMKNTISSNYTVSTDYNAQSIGTITVATGVTVTVPSGSRWVVV
jgi:hypothetical protein